ncbi:hypothetical protein D9V32_05600 [Mycetocola tolaasinivorans]|uniref:Uncharacterized protein n=1 Tax=Mycetocola tolaasinivorans TaxID=76635 RepID=A0A3L7A8B9_9MICO|nr:hypothetical protein [Mycetocola tolaasinivorans]RLP76345.1 hypothetical protein D9V32_05600 [Mycetocola tolaasinivorans]
MSRHNVTTEITEILATSGLTEDEAKTRFRLDRDGSDWLVWNRADEAFITRHLLDLRDSNARAAQLATAGHAEWRMISGVWVLAGTGLTEGDIVTVSRRNGTTSEEIVGQIIATKNGITLARVGSL